MKLILSVANRAFLWSDKEIISEKDIQAALINRVSEQNNIEIHLTLGQKVNINDILDIHRKNYVKAALKACGNNKTKAAEMLGLKSHQVLTKWIKDLVIETI